MVASYRLKHGLTQKELAEKSGITQTNISAYESGKRNLTRKAAEKLANALGENADKFFMAKK
ncbi:MAG: helix-turn-helix transcriptional regulator [Lentisphaeria bacterium]|nr:helix-turn-helix transcriptional regulator [Lentisphaeria bacterium]